MGHPPTDNELNAWDTVLWDLESTLSNVDAQRLIAEVRRLHTQERYGNTADPAGVKTQAELQLLRRKCGELQTTITLMEEEVAGHEETLRKARIALGML